MRNEVARVLVEAGASAEIVFERRKRADPTGVLDDGAPDCGRDVQPGNPAPSQDDNAAEQDEEDERDVKSNDGVGEDRKHGLPW